MIKDFTENTFKLNLVPMRTPNFHGEKKVGRLTLYHTLNETHT